MAQGKVEDYGNAYVCFAQYWNISKDMINSAAAIKDILLTI
jgi:hypothetical protein